METCGVDKTIFSVVLTSEVYLEPTVCSYLRKCRECIQESDMLFFKNISSVLCQM